MAFDLCRWLEAVEVGRAVRSPRACGYMGLHAVGKPIECGDFAASDADVALVNFLLEIIQLGVAFAFNDVDIARSRGLV
jgi:hypothetical protein